MPAVADKKRNYFSGLSTNSFLLALTSLFADISSEMLYPILPIFLTQTLKAGGSIVGIVKGVAETTQNIVQGFSGWLSDKWQKRKGIAFFGYILAALSKPLIGLANSWPLVLGGRFLDRLGGDHDPFRKRTPGRYFIKNNNGPEHPALSHRLLEISPGDLSYAGFASSKDLRIIAALFCLYGIYQGIFRSVGKAMAAVNDHLMEVPEEVKVI